jgi:hypothetical protein
VSSKVKWLTLLGLALLASAVPVASASQERFQSKSEAAAANDPAADGASIGAPTTAIYKGQRLAFSEIRDRTPGHALHCAGGDARTGEATRCFDTFEQAYGMPAASSARHKRRAHTASCAWTYQVHYQWRQWNANGETYGFQGRTYWQNLPSYMNNDTSAYRMGDHGGHLAEDTNGNGYWYPGQTGYCDAESITDVLPSWDNRISSGWRSLN